jgi:predicted enzyme related to lactoylglutathione lyase
VDIPVRDLDRAIGFYSAVLGTAVSKQQAGPEFEFGLLPHTNDNVAGCLAVMPDSEPSEKGPLVYLKVEGRLDDAVQKARDGGGRVLQEKHAIGPYGHRAIIVDSEGNRIALHSNAA